MNNIVFIGVDTYGLPTDYQAEITAINNWPRIAQITWMLTDENGEVIKHKRRIISHEGNEIPMGAVSQQGITKETAERDGMPIAMVLSELKGDMAQVKRIVAHNIDYYRRIIEAEMIRLNMSTDIFSQAEAICTMQASTAYCMLPPMNNGKYKWPKLSELHLKLFGYSIDKSCDIATQLVITKNCYIELVRREVITPKVRTIIEHGNCGAKGDNVKYELTDDGELVIYGEGKMKDSFISSPFQNKENIKVVIIKEGVTEIGEGAFSGCSTLTSVTIPEGITSIGNNAFKNCRSLTSVTIPESVTKIGNGAFNDCSSLTSVTIPKSVTWIEGFTFNGCSALTSVTIPESVTKIRWNAFDGCSSLTSVTIPESVTEIGQRAFYDCSSLTSVTIPENVTWIGESAFYGTALYNTESNWDNNILYIDNCFIKAKDIISGEYIIKKGTRLIGGDAFIDCSSLTNVTIPESVTKIGFCAFKGCSSLTSVTIPKSVTEIGYGTFENCISLTSVTIPEGVTKIDISAFKNCRSLTSVTIPESVTMIGIWAFEDCSSLTSVQFNAKNCTLMGDYNHLVFGNCRQLNSLTIGENVTFIPDYAFNGCSSLTSVTIPESVTKIGRDAFYDTALYNTESNWDNNVLYIDNCLIKAKDIISGEYIIKNGTRLIGESAFWKCSSLTSVTIPEGVTWIGWETFKGCSSLTSVTIPKSVTEIGDWAFSGCSSLTNVTIPESVTMIGNWAFEDCSSLTNVTIPESVTEIGYAAFANCRSLRSVTIPSGVTKIGDYAFAECTGFTSITCKNTTPPEVGCCTFEFVYTSIPLYVPVESVEAYKNASGWKNFRNIQAIP